MQAKRLFQRCPQRMLCPPTSTPIISVPGGIYLQQVDRVTPTWARWPAGLKRSSDPSASWIVDVPIEMDDGRIAHFEGYRAQHNLSRGPGKGGGVRFHQDVTLSEVMALSAG